MINRFTEAITLTSSIAVDYYLGAKHDFIGVLSFYGINNTDTYYTLNDLENHINDSGYFIVSYWNTLNSDGSPNIFEGLHTQFIYRHSDADDFISHNHNLTKTNLYEFIDSNLLNSQHKFISGNVIIQ